MQIVGKPKKLKSREPLILLGLRRVIQVVLPLGSGGTPVQVQVLSPAPITKESLVWLFCCFMRTIKGLEPALAEGEHNRAFAPNNRNPIFRVSVIFYI